MSSRVDVAIIGAGLAGLSAARALQRSGRSVRVLEARDRVGGRTEAGCILGQDVDVGGQWLGPGQDRALMLCREFGVETYAQHDLGQRLIDFDGRVRAYTGTIPKLPILALLDADRAIKRLNRLARTLDPAQPWAASRAAEWDAQTAQDWMLANTRTRGARAVIEIATRAIFSCEPRDLSLLYFLHYVATSGSVETLAEVTQGAQQDRIRGGAFQLARLLAQTLAPDSVRLGCPVHTLRREGGGYVVDHAGGSLQARRVIVALAPMLADRIRFEPALPASRALLATHMPMGSVIKILVAYPRPFWREAGFSGEAVSDRLPFSPVFDAGLPGRSEGLLVGFIEGDHARRYGVLDPAKRRQAVVDSLVHYFGPAAREPLDYVEKDWCVDPWSRGCYVGLAQPGVLTAAGAALRAPCQGIHWAGTETATRWTGYMDGALESGERAATEVLAALA